MNRRRTGARTALSASSLDLVHADMAVRAPIGGLSVGSTIPESRIETMNPIVLVRETKRTNRERRGGRRGGSWKPHFRFCARIGTMTPPHPTFGHPLPIRWGEGRGEGSVHGKPPFFCARIGTMNYPLTPALFPNGGEGGRRPGEGAVRGERIHFPGHLRKRSAN